MNKTIVFLVLTAALSIPALGLPQEIADYYERQNFVASFSTPAERDTLVRVAHRSPERAQELEGRPGKILEYMRLNEEMLARTEPAMPSSKRLLPNAVGFGDVFEIVETEGQGNSISVRVALHRLRRQDNARLVALYEERSGEDREGFPSDRIWDSIAKESGGFALHQWMKTSTGWVRSAVAVYLLDV